MLVSKAKDHLPEDAGKSPGYMWWPNSQPVRQVVLGRHTTAKLCPLSLYLPGFLGFGLDSYLDYNCLPAFKVLVTPGKALIQTPDPAAWATHWDCDTLRLPDTCPASPASCPLLPCLYISVCLTSSARFMARSHKAGRGSVCYTQRTSPLGKQSGD